MVGGALSRLAAAGDYSSLGRMIRRLAIAVIVALGFAAPAAAEWREASSDHFVIYADAPEPWLREFAERLELYDSALRLVRPVPAIDGLKSNRVTVYAVYGVEAVQKLCGRCGSVAGFYVPRVGGSVAYSARTAGKGAGDLSSDIVLFHEYAHHYMLSNSGVAYPRWMTEGFAEFHSTARITREGGVEIGRPANHRAYGLFNARMPVARVLDPPARLDAAEADQFYGRAWALFHYLTFEPSRRGQIAKYLAAVNSGKSALDAGRDAFGDLAVLDKALNAYLYKAITYVPIKPDQVKTGPIAVRRLSAGEAATMPVRMRSDRGVSRTAALALLPEARRRAAGFPIDPGAQNVLAEAEFDAGNDAEAEAAADRVLAVAPADLHALLYKGRVKMRRAVQAKATDADIWRDARGWFLKANKADSNAAMPFVLYYASFQAQGVRPNASAVAGLERAFELSPQDSGLRWDVTRQYLLDNKTAAARQTLLPLAYDPHGGEQSAFAVRLIGMIDKGVPGPKIADERPSSAADVRKADQPDGS